MPAQSAFTLRVEPTDSGKRLDLYIAALIPECSRSVATTLIRNGRIKVRGSIKKPGYRVKAGDEVHGYIPPPAPILFKPEPIPIDILFEDDYIIVVNKQPGLVVHPAPGHYSGTLVNGLLYHCPFLEGIGSVLRPGIVHRLDKDTSGILVVAKNDQAHQHLAKLFKSRRIRKKYLALVSGLMESDAATISLPIGRHPVDRKKMSTRSNKTRVAVTTWRIKEKFESATLIELDLKTGRTHQIRVHCAAIHHPIVGDTVYGGKNTWKNTVDGQDLFGSIKRQMLHAWRLEFSHPATQEPVCFEAPLPSDMQDVIDALRRVSSATKTRKDESTKR
jgi:23S rRNA pseudouridine1911/1915/1917 synthase